MTSRVIDICKPLIVQPFYLASRFVKYIRTDEKAWLPILSVLLNFPSLRVCFGVWEGKEGMGRESFWDKEGEGKITL